MSQQVITCPACKKRMTLVPLIGPLEKAVWRRCPHCKNLLIRPHRSTRWFTQTTCPHYNCQFDGETGMLCLDCGYAEGDYQPKRDVNTG